MMEIRSYRHVFDLERRIYRIDRVRLNPAGVPVRGILYFLVLLGGASIAVRVPLLGIVAGALPWYARDVALPGALAAMLTVIRVEGRPFHLAVRALLGLHVSRRRFGGRELGAGRRAAGETPERRWHPAPILILPDGSDSRPRRLRYTGPGALRVAVAHERRTARGPLVWLGLRPHLRIRPIPPAPLPARAEVVVLDRSIRLHVR
jgi:hypothetical protein